MKREVWKPTEVPPLDPGLPDDVQWNLPVQHCQFKFESNYPSDFGELTDGEKILFRQHQGFWTLASHYLYKIGWNRKYKIPIPRRKLSEAANVKAFAEVLLAWKTLCEKLHTKSGQDYVNAGEWFRWISMEIATHGLVLSLYGIESEDDARALAGKISSTKAGNPFNKEVQLHQWRIAEAVLSESPDTRIVKEYWKGSRSQKEGHRGLAEALIKWAIAQGKMPRSGVYKRRYFRTAKQVQAIEVILAQN